MNSILSKVESLVGTDNQEIITKRKVAVMMDSITEIPTDELENLANDIKGYIKRVSRDYKDNSKDKLISYYTKVLNLIDNELGSR